MGQKKRAHAPLWRAFRHLNDKKTPEHWRSARPGLGDGQEIGRSQSYAKLTLGVGQWQVH
jgi:hypothetical protein